MQRLPQEEEQPRHSNAPAMQQQVVGTTLQQQERDLQQVVGTSTVLQQQQEERGLQQAMGVQQQGKGQQVCFSARTSQIPYVKQIVGALKVMSGFTLPVGCISKWRPLVVLLVEGMLLIPAALRAISMPESRRA